MQNPKKNPDKSVVQYPIAAANTWPIGNILAYVSDNIAKTIPKQRISAVCVGHSLGSHVCGFFGKMLKGLKSKISLETIFGLDPAGPIFQDDRQHSTLRLDKDDAFRTVIIHTNTKRYGFQRPVGHTDIFVNGGAQQPWCRTMSKVLQCSHKYAYLFMVELTNPTKKERKCTAVWKCNNEAYKKLGKIKKKDKAKLTRLGCVLQDRRNALQLGYLTDWRDYSMMRQTKEGIFWVEVGDKSSSCKFPRPK